MQASTSQAGMALRSVTIGGRSVATPSRQAIARYTTRSQLQVRQLSKTASLSPTVLKDHRPTRTRILNRSFFSLTDISKLAGLIPGQNQSSSGVGVEDGSSIHVDGEIQHFHARKILPYSPKQLYQLVSDVPSYSSFIPFCNSSTVLSPPPTATATATGSNGIGNQQEVKREWKDWKAGDEPFNVRAELAVGFGGLEERYVSKVVGRPYESVTATASKQTPLFKSLISTWSFLPASSHSPHPSSPSSSPPSSDSREPNSLSTPDPDVGPTLLTIDLAFNFANPLHRIASQAVLPKVADKMIEAFEKRCLEVWGEGTQ